MVDKEPQSDLDTKFKTLQDEIIQQMRITHQDLLDKYPSIAIKVVTNEPEGGFQSLILNSKGEWDGRPDRNYQYVLTQYAIIKDSGFKELVFSHQEAEERYSQQASPEVTQIMSLIVSEPNLQLSNESQSFIDEFMVGLNAVSGKWQLKEQEYISDNRQRLSIGLFQEMELKLQNLKEYHLNS